MMDGKLKRICNFFLFLQRDMYLKIQNITVIKDTNNLMKIIFNSLCLEYQNNLFEKMRDSDFIFYCLDKTYTVVTRQL